MANRLTANTVAPPQAWEGGPIHSGQPRPSTPSFMVTKQGEMSTSPLPRLRGRGKGWGLRQVQGEASAGVVVDRLSCITMPASAPGTAASPSGWTRSRDGSTGPGISTRPLGTGTKPSGP